ncbi:MAG: DUF4168 domain-containing protein [Nitrospirota bacterium]|nr:DUF4168 domain-containing protein [Nitrospirota bacterium]
MKSIPMRLKSLRVLFLITSVLCLSPLAALNAQVAESQPPQKEITGDILEPFAGAYKEVSQIHTTYEQRIIESNGPTQADALQQEANQKMIQAVADHGLTIEDYNTIFKNIEKDPALKKEFMTVLNRTR